MYKQNLDYSGSYNETTDLKPKRTFQGDSVTGVTILNKHIIEDNFGGFVVAGDEHTIQYSVQINFEALELGDRPRQLKAKFAEDNREEVTRLLRDGNKFMVYFEHNEVIIEAEALYFANRYTQINLHPNRIHYKKNRAKRFKTNRQVGVRYQDKDGAIAYSMTTLNDISETGVSFYCADNLGNRDDKVELGNKYIVIVERRNLRNKYFYRAYFMK